MVLVSCDRMNNARNNVVGFKSDKYQSRIM